jgi:hypothetical protein
MSQSVLLPACAILLGAVAALLFGKPKAVLDWGAATPRAGAAEDVSAAGDVSEAARK